MWILTEQLITSHFAPDTKALEWDSETFGRMCEKSLMWRSKPSQSRTWRQRLKRVGYIQHLFTRALKPSHSNTFLEKWISFLPDSHANPLVLPEDDNQQMIRDIYTHISLKESHSVDQLMLFSKMSKESSQAKPQTENRYLNMSSETWKKEVISHRGEYSARLKLVRPINENESLSWPTARNSDAEGGRIETEMSEKGFRSKQIKEGKWHNIQLREAIDLENEKNWSTPNTLDHLPPKEGEAMQRLYDTHRKGRTSPSNLREQVNPKSWPTPKSRDWKGGMGTSKERQKHDLDKIVHLPNTQQDQEKSSTSGKSQGRLNPNWVEQLMGLPVGWTQLPTEWID